MTSITRVGRWTKTFPRELWIISAATFINRSVGFLGLFAAAFFTSLRFSPALVAIALFLVGTAGITGSVIGGRMASIRDPISVLIFGSLLNVPLLLGLAWTARYPIVVLALSGASVAVSQSFLAPAATLVTESGYAGSTATAFAFYRIFINIGSIIAPAIVGVLGAFEFPLLFVMSGVGSIFTAVLLIAGRRMLTTNRAARIDPVPDLSDDTPATGRGRTVALWAVIIVFAVAIAIYAQHQSGIPLSVDRLAGGARLYATLLVINPAIIIGCELPLSYLVSRLPWRYSLAMGVAANGVGLAITGLGESWVVCIAGFVVFSLGEALFAPQANAAVAQLSRPGENARFQGYLSAAQTAGIAVGPAIGAYAAITARISFWSAVLVISLLMGAAIMVVANPRRGFRIKRKSASVPVPGERISHTDGARNTMTCRPVALIVDPVSSGAMYASILDDLDVSYLLLDTDRALHAGLRSKPTPGALSFDEDFGNSPDRVVEWALDQGVTYVVAASESGTELCEYLRSNLDRVPCNEVSEPARRWNKEHIFAALAASGVDTLRTVVVDSADDIDDAALAALRSEGSLVVKPAIGAGSVDVRLVHDPTDLRTAVTAIVDHPGFFGDRPRVLLQEAFPSPYHEYVIDTFTSGGNHEIVAVSVYEKHLSHTGDFVYDQIRWLPADDPAVPDLVRYSRSVLDALGVRVGPSHMEVMAGPRLGPRLIDFGARAHGSGHPAKTFHLTGRSQIHRECAYISGTDHEQALYALSQHGAIVFFNTDSHVRFNGSVTAEDLDRLPGVVESAVNASAGSVHTPTRSLIDGLALGMAFIVADDPNELAERARVVRSRFDRGLTSLEV